MSTGEKQQGMGTNDPGQPSVVTPAAGLRGDITTGDNPNTNTEGIDNVPLTSSTPLLQETSATTNDGDPDIHILQMNTSAVDFLRMLGHIPDDDGRFEQDVESFLKQTNVISFIDFTDLSQMPYDKYTQFVDAVTFHRLIPFIIDMKLLVQYIYDFADFEALLKQTHQKTDVAWARVMNDKKEHTQRFMQYQRTYHDDEYEIYREESSEHDKTQSIARSIASRRSRGSHGMGKPTRQQGTHTRTKMNAKGDEISVASTIQSKRVETDSKGFTAQYHHAG
jgi:hypothetical protein